MGRKPSHRKALHRNMVTSLIKHERIETTQAKAKEIRRTAEKLVTRAKVDSVHNRRIVAKTVYEKDVLNKLFTEVGPRFSERPGGYTRILKLGKRSGDAASMVILEFLPEEEKPASRKKSVSRKKAAPKPAAAKKSAVKGEETKAEEAPVKEPEVEESSAEEAPVKEPEVEESPAEEAKKEEPEEKKASKTEKEATEE